MNRRKAQFSLSSGAVRVFLASVMAKVDEEEEERMLDARLGTTAQDDADAARNPSSSSDDDDGDSHMSRAAQEVLAAMPKTDKQKRHEARVKLMAR